jgi:hypothetical protein
VPTKKPEKTSLDGHTCGEMRTLSLPGTAVNTLKKWGRAALISPANASPGGPLPPTATDIPRSRAAACEIRSSEGFLAEPRLPAADSSQPVPDSSQSLVFELTPHLILS